MSEHDPKKSNYYPLEFYVAYPTTGVSDTEMSAVGEATAADMPQVPVPFAGSIVGFSVAVEAACAAGTADLVATINGVTAHADVAFQIEATTITQYTAAQYDRGLYAVTQNQRIGMQYTTTSTWTAGPSASIRGVVWVHAEENS